ncbi:hypothetical protein RF11_04149 [Thelohanellus kitauei]|uniref:Uncharacterized protein n=1 Tax=Thelohanellus kitauei TaxID=669202 RepID=A0A0C2N2W9_THEKT|nr:hypothetical protein RF11_04149 [Thelohanellus kitauei]
MSCRLLISILASRLHKELDAARINEIPRPASRISKKSSSFSRPRREILSDDDLREYQIRKQAETQELYNDIDEASSKLLKLTTILENINQAINDNRFVPITNDSMVAQQCYIYKIQLDLLKIHQKDLDWLLNFTSPCKLCAIEIPDSLLIQITDLKSSWSSTKNRVLQSQDALSKIRELWILFEYYTVRIILWNKAVKTKQSTWDVEVKYGDERSLKTRQRL